MNENILKEKPAEKGGFSLGSLVLLVGVVIVIAVVALQFMRQGETLIGNTAPDFSLELYSGDDFQLSDHKGQIVLVNFWGSWCGPCRDEAPELQEVWEEYQDEGVMIVGVGYLDTESDALAFINEMDLTYPTGADVGSKIAKEYRIQGAPENFIVDAEGKIHYLFKGPMTYDQITSIFDELLGKA